MLLAFIGSPLCKEMVACKVHFLRNYVLVKYWKIILKLVKVNQLSEISIIASSFAVFAFILMQLQMVLTGS